MNLGPTGANYQERKNPGAIVMVAKIRLRTMANLRYGQICHIMQAIANRPIIFFFQNANKPDHMHLIQTVIVALMAQVVNGPFLKLCHAFV